MDSGPSTPLPDKKLLVFILDRLQKCVFLALLSVFLTLCVCGLLFNINFLVLLISGRTSMVCFPNQWTPTRLVLGVMTTSAFGSYDMLCPIFTLILLLKLLFVASRLSRNYRSSDGFWNCTGEAYFWSL